MGCGWTPAFITVSPQRAICVQPCSALSTKPLLPWEAALHRVWGSGRDEFRGVYGAEGGMSRLAQQPPQLGLSSFSQELGS